MVIKDNPDFPSDPSEVIIKKIPTGGPVGTTANVKFSITVEKVNETTYIITLIKDWGFSVNGRYVKSYWKYKVTTGRKVLLSKEDNDYLPNTMK